MARRLRWLALVCATLACPAAEPTAPAPTNEAQQPGPRPRPGPDASAHALRPVRRTQLVANESFGPFTIGMTRAEFEQAAILAGLTVTPGYTAINAHAGPYFVAFTDPGERLSTVLAELIEVGDVEFEGAVISPRLDARSVAGELRDCGPVVIVTGGDVIHCAGRIEVSTGIPDRAVELRVSSELASMWP